MAVVLVKGTDGKNTPRSLTEGNVNLINNKMILGGVKRTPEEKERLKKIAQKVEKERVEKLAEAKAKMALENGKGTPEAPKTKLTGPAASDANIEINRLKNELADAKSSVGSVVKKTEEELAALRAENAELKKNSQGLSSDGKPAPLAGNDEAGELQAENERLKEQLSAQARSKEEVEALKKLIHPKELKRHNKSFHGHDGE